MKSSSNVCINFRKSVLLVNKWRKQIHDYLSACTGMAALSN